MNALVSFLGSNDNWTKDDGDFFRHIWDYSFDGSSDDVVSPEMRIYFEQLIKKSTCNEVEEEEAA